MGHPVNNSPRRVPIRLRPTTFNSQGGESDFPHYNSICPTKSRRINLRAPFQLRSGGVPVLFLAYGQASAC